MKIIKIKTSRGKDGIEVNLFKYRKDKTMANGEISWRCLDRKCSASLKTNNAVTAVTSKYTPGLHNHEPQTPSEPSTPTSQTSSLLTPTRSISDSADILVPSPAQTPSLSELLSPYTTITPEPPKFPNLYEENNYLRQRVAELVYTNEALTDRLISLEKQIIELNDTIRDTSNTTISTEIQTDETKELDDTTKSKSVSTNVQDNTNLTVNISTQTETFPITSMEGINVVEADMGEVIDDLRRNSSIAFAHTISGDFYNSRQMSAGVAVIFKKKFNKPKEEDCLTKSLTYQKTAEGAGVYGLVTKPIYYGKPTQDEYDQAFDDFIVDFKERGFTTLICSPMGCVRDLIKLDHFAMKINEFHKITGAPVIIVTKDQKARRVLRHGLSHTEFVKQLRSKIKRCTQGAADWFRLPDEDMKVYIDKIPTPKNTIVLDPAVSHLIKKSQTPEEVYSVLKDAALDTYEYVLAPVNDRKDDSQEGGSHWSLLMYTRDTDTYHHLDSLEPLNTEHAERLAARLSGDPCVNVVQLRCRRQQQGVECGAYVLHNIELICSRINKQIPIQDDRCYVQNFSVSRIYESIERLKKSNQIRIEPKTVKGKVTLLSDSHGRGLCHLLQSRLGERSAVLSVVKPNATLENVTGGMDREITGLKSSDHLVVLGGTNNIDGRTEYDIKPFVNELANKTKHTNLVLCTVPLRYDKPHLNKKIRKINIDLVIEALKYDHIKIISLSYLSKILYNSKGIHFSNRGKEKLSQLIVNKIRNPVLN